jgi:hypothetical protein
VEKFEASNDKSIMLSRHDCRSWHAVLVASPHIPAEHAKRDVAANHLGRAVINRVPIDAGRPPSGRQNRPPRR